MTEEYETESPEIGRQKPQSGNRTSSQPPSLLLRTAANKKEMNIRQSCFTAASILFTIHLAICLSPCAAAIDCFKCVSVNGDNPTCEDPFHNNFSTSIMESPCLAGRKHRNGLFPATACIKLAGYHRPTNERILIRACALDSGSLTTDTEIIRVSHCGSFYFNNRYIKGCLQSCDDSDGCNEASSILTSQLPLRFFLQIFFIRCLSNFI